MQLRSNGELLADEKLHNRNILDCSRAAEILQNDTKERWTDYSVDEFQMVIK